MRRLKVAYRPEARADLENIYRSVLEISQNENVATGFYNRIIQRCIRIGLVPYGGRGRDDLALGLRLVPFEHSAIIAYTVENNRVEITNVFHGGRDYEAFYLGTTAGDEDPVTEE